MQLPEIKFSENFQVIENKGFEAYTGENVQIFEDRSKWHYWQKYIYGLIFNQDFIFKKSNKRITIILADFKEVFKKSSFLQWLYYKNLTLVGRIRCVIATLVPLSALSLGRKKRYIIDLTRSNSKIDAL